MNRPIRTASAALRTLFAAAALSCMAWSAQALEFKPYSGEALAAAQKEGKPVAVHFHADWCPTCKLQQKSFAQLQTEKGLDLTVLVADYDKERDLKREMKVRTQSTLVVFKGSEERGRTAGDASPDKLRATLKQAF